MAKKHKLTRKDIKAPDEFISTTTTVIEYVQEQWKMFAGIAAAVVCIIVIVAAVGAYRSAQEEKAATALAGAEEVFQAPVKTEIEEGDQIPDNVAVFDDAILKYREAEAKFVAVADEHGSSHAGRMALLYAGESAYKAGEPEKAVEHFRAFLAKESAESYLAQLAIEGLGYAYEDLGRYAESAAEFEKNANSTWPEVRPGGMLNAARTYAKTGETAKAIALYEQFLAEYPNSSMKRTATDGLADLGAGNG